MKDLSKEELLAIIAAQQEEIKRKDDEYNRRISKIERDFAELQEKYNKLLKKTETKLHIIKVNNHNKYYSTKESSFVKENKLDASLLLMRQKLICPKIKDGLKEVKTSLVSI